MKENINLDTSEILYGRITIEEMSKRLLSEVIDVVKGKLTTAEKLGHTELHLHFMNQKHKPYDC